jgi:predicted dehydrogenase
MLSLLSLEELLEQRYSGTYRAAIIGHTGRGNYGHGLDVAFVGLPGVEIVAVADPDEQGRHRVQAVTGAPRAYADYREMLERERPDLVAVAPRWLDQREAMVVACAQAGVQAIYCEKPFARSLDEADRMLAACDARGVKIAVAHQNRARPAVWLAKELIVKRTIGRLRMIRTFGKQDRRGGGQDLLVLGTHMLDLMRFFAGEARWCHARVVAWGRDATAADVRPADEEGGLIAGDDIVAQYGFDHGITGTYESTRSDDGGGSPYLHTELCGTSGILVFWNDAGAPVFYLPRPFALPDRTYEWEVLHPAPLPEPASTPPGASAQHAANQVLVRDLLAAVEQGRQPISSGHDARAALEMILAVYESHRRGTRVCLPLAERTHPLRRW